MLSLLEPAPARVLDVGAGTGLLSALVVDSFPAVRLDLLDGSEPMLSEACERLGESVTAVHVADIADAQVQWLREAGFASVDCVYKSWRFAVMAGFKEDGQ